MLLVALGWWWRRRRWLPGYGLAVAAAAYLLSSRSGSWIGTPDFALLEETLARALGPWPLPKLGLLLLVWAAVRRWGLDPAGSDGLATGRVLDASGVIPTALMVVEPGFNSARALEEARLLISQMSSVQAVGVVLIGTPLPEELSSSVVG